jgi:uncharacterized lipoprotein YddW (UPF0748 family)
MDLKDLVALPRALDAAEVHAAYVRAGGIERPKWILAIAPESQPTPVLSDERRVMQDEDTGWASSKLEIERRVSRVKAAGFNVYMPNVWNGAFAYYSALNGHVAPSVHDPADPHYDPLAYLIEVAHREGITVHPWIIVARNPGGSVFPDSFVDGAPPAAFNIQSASFRDFIVETALDLARRYDIDGLNLDYIRAMGPCSNRECVDGYAQRYGRSVQQDWTSQENGETIPSLIEWNRAATTDIVSRVALGMRTLRPRAPLTVDTVPFDRSREHQGLDEETWLRRGWIGAVIYMAYDDPIDVAGMDHAFQVFTPQHLVVNVRDYDWIGTTAVDRSGYVMEDYVRLIRTRWPRTGIGFYHYPHFSTDQMLKLGRGSFQAVAVPTW